MSSMINLHSFFATIVLLLLVDFNNDITFQLGLNGERRSRFVTTASTVGNQESVDPDPMDFLRKYGYLPRSDMETQELRTDGEQKTAIRRFQKMAGIRMTGTVDQATMDAMRKERCGMPDVMPQDFRQGPSKWDKEQLTYRIVSYTSDVSQTSVDDDVRRAMRVWSEVTPLTFRQIYSGEADLMISFRRLVHGDGYQFDGQGRVLAHAFPPGDGRGGDIHFDDDENWTIDSPEGINLFLVSAHELGHSLGLLHSEDQNALMYPAYQGYQPMFRLSYDDITGMQSIYGPRSGQPGNPDHRPPTFRPTPSPKYSTQRPRVPQTTPADGSDLCNSRLDAVALIRQQIFVFSGKWYWRLIKNDAKAAQNHRRYLISSFWTGLPVDLDRIDAAFERPTDGAIIFFRGRRYWQFTANNLSPGFTRDGNPITDLGLPDSVDHLDAAFDWEMNRRIYLVSGDTYWKMTTDGTQTEDGYPLGMDMWNGVQLPVDAAFTHFDGHTYFLKGQEIWALEKGKMQTTVESPKHRSSLWTSLCMNAAASSTPSVNLFSSVLSSCLLFVVYAILTCSLQPLT